MDQHKIKLKLKYKLVDSTGCTDCKNFIVDTGITYYVKFRIVSNAIDLGYFNVDLQYTGDTSISAQTYVVTGQTTSRLSDIEKFTRSTDISIKYKTTTTIENDGLLLSESITGQTYTYYIGGIKYIDNVSANTTTYEFTRTISDVDFQNNSYYKDESKQNIISKPKIINDINVERQAPTIMDIFYRIKDINILNDFSYYGGGSIFNIVKNS